jgi:hypothetical protein
VDAAPAADGGGEQDAAVYAAPLTAGEWAGMDLEARKKFMREMVVPSMRQAFQDFDSERFAAFGCRTCHGAGVADGSFAMPASEVPTLSSAALMDPAPENVAITDFMRNVVRPQFQALLGAESGTPAAVRCSTCHTIAQ